MARTWLWAALLWAWGAGATDWPQLQHDGSRTGRTADSVAPPYRARWIWVGGTTLRNKDSVAGWPHDLTARTGYSYPMPASAGLTLNEGVQAIVAQGKVYVGSMDGTAYAIDALDGTTLWTRPLPGGTLVSAAVTGGVVVFASAPGTLHAFNAATGAPAWTFACKKALTGAPAVDATNLYVADHGGYVYAVDPSNGAQRWRTRLPAPVLGGLALDSQTVYVGAENMTFYALNVSNGAVRHSKAVRGQSFRTLWPVVASGRVFVHTATTPVIGSEYIMETLMDGASSLSDEEAKIARWLTGDTNGGQWNDAGEDWRHLFALSTVDLTEPAVVLAGPAEGCGVPTEPVVVDDQGRVLTYFKTRFPTFTASSAFGTRYAIDISAIDLSTGRRITLGSQLANLWPWETDNLYALSVGGSYLWMRQEFRGTQVVSLARATCAASGTCAGRGVSALIRNRDGGVFNFDVVYFDSARGTQTTQTPMSERAAPTISGNLVYIVESFGVTAIEHRP